MDEEHSGDDKRGNNSFFNDGDDDKTCDEGSTPQSGHICIFWAAKKVRHKNAIFSQGKQKLKIV